MTVAEAKVVLVTAVSLTTPSLRKNKGFCSLPEAMSAENTGELAVIVIYPVLPSGVSAARSSTPLGDKVQKAQSFPVSTNAVP